eukprot:Hpha_TRINITY_DN15495_c2_g1::TRINITY_DN15495_c2_g1_i28::g.173945::m.173945
MALMCFARVSRREELIALELPLDGCIGDLRREVAAAAGISESSFDIFLGEESLRDDTTLADSGITSEAVVDARTRDEIRWSQEERHKRLRKDDGVIADNGRELTYHCHDGWYGVRAESGSSCGVMIVDYEVQGEAVMLGLALEDIRDTGFYDGCCTGASWLVYTGDGECCEPYSSEEAQGWHSSELRKASHFPDEGEEAEDEETEGEGEEAEDEEAAKAAADHTDFLDRTPLHVAVLFATDPVPVIHELLRLGATACSRTPMGENPFKAAVRTRRWGVAQALLDMAADIPHLYLGVSVPDVHGITALHHAAAAGNTDLCRRIAAFEEADKKRGAQKGADCSRPAPELLRVRVPPGKRLNEVHSRLLDGSTPRWWQFKRHRWLPKRERKTWPMESAAVVAALRGRWDTCNVLLTELRRIPDEAEHARLLDRALRAPHGATEAVENAGFGRFWRTQVSDFMLTLCKAPARWKA